MKHTKETKERLSLIRKKWLLENPDKHPWRNKNKFKSKPCELVKNFLKNSNIQYIEEYQPNINNRFFSIDIAFPDKKIGIEINGNQHYNSDGTLKDYYQNRHNLLESNGWIIYEIHYSICFQILKLKELFDNLENYKTVQKFEYKTYQVKKYTKYNSCSCNRKKLKSSPLCLKCSRLKSRKVKNRPSKEELEKLIWEKPFTKLAKDFGVSDVMIKKWCKGYKISNFPKRGFFLKKK